MTPKIQIPINDILKTLHHAARKRINTGQVLKEKEKTAYTKRDYQRKRVELNQTKFLQPLDADNSKASIYYIRQKLTRYVSSNALC
jgi:hypothetical protein